MDGIYELKEMLCKELEEYGSKGELTAGSLEIVDRLAHAVKNLNKILDRDADGYSERGPMYDRRNYVSRGRGAGAKRDSMGRYSSRYSMAEGRDDMVRQLQDMKNDAPSKKVMDRIDELIAEIERV